ncbi:hypothetical protein [Nocardia higoensis]|uniref:hypothetical protein n=1 Tax=Nocardia higoensis TaxID=228599 RepID=UPI0002D6D6E8|nr:hypothetical protein [Nocardia higoensis]
MATDNADNTDDKGAKGTDDETVVPDKEASADRDAETVVVKKAASTEAGDETEKVSIAKAEPAATADRAAPAPSGDDGKRRGMAPIIAAFVAGILLVAAVTAVVVFYLQADRRGAELAAVDDATRAACDFGRTVSEYDYANDLEGYFTKVKDNATGEFREEFDQAGQALSEAMVQAQVKSWVDDVQCGFQNGDTEQATVLVTMTQFRTNFTQPTPDRQYIVVIADLKNEDGKWKVAKLDSPMLKGSGGALPGGTPAPAQGAPTEGAPAEGAPAEEAPAPAPGN